MLIFLHNMRTGGETLRTLIARQYLENGVCTVLGKPESLSEIDDIQGLDVNTTKVIQGHIPFGLHEVLPTAVKYIVMLRNPVDRVISLFHHIREDPELGYHDIMGAHLSSLSDFITSGRLSEVDNGQTRRLSGLYPAFGSCNEDMLRAAKRNLGSCAVVGTTERFDESLLMMKRAFGWSNVFYHKINTTQTRPDRQAVSPEELELIQHYNALDSELFEYAERLVEAAVERQAPDFQRELESFKLVNRELAKCTQGFSRAPSRVHQQEPETEPSMMAPHGLPKPLLEAQAYLLSREPVLLQDTLRLRRREARLQREKALLKKKLHRARTQIRQMESSRVWRLNTWYRQAGARVRAMLHL
jgi:hypothetical protein